MKPVDPFSLSDLIPLEELQQLQDTLADINRVTSLITDRHGNALTMPSNEMPLCTLIRRSTRGEAMCTAEAQAIANGIRDTRQTVCRACQPLGFLNAAVPIQVNGRHLGNWWILQQCANPDVYDEIGTLAKRLGLDAETILAEIEQLPDCNQDVFKKVVDWIQNLVTTLAQIGFQNHILSLNASKLDRVEGELQQYKTRLENLVQERTADLIKANNQLQLEVLERNLAEEQIERKSKLLDAINQVLKHTLDDFSDEILTQTFLKAAQQITGSPFGFVVEQLERCWKITAHSPLRNESGNAPPTDRRHWELNIQGLWRELVGTGRTIMLAHLDEDAPRLGLPDHFPALRALLAVPLCKNGQIFGMVVLANSIRGYYPIDRTDMEALARAFMEALLRKRMERDKDTSEERLNLAMDSANEGLWDYTPPGREIYFNPSWFTMLGYNAGELPSTIETWAALSHPDDFPELQQRLDGVSDGREATFRVEIRMLAQVGQWRWIQVQGRSVETGPNGRSLRIVGTLHDISRYKQIEVALQKANEELQRLAALDGLTQIANRMRFDDRMIQEWRRARRDGNPLALVLGDIDYFKEYNDTYGHIKGDEALYAVAQAISAALKRPMDMVARYGGEEFAIVLPNTNLPGAMRVVNEVRAAVDALKIEHKTSRAKDHLTLSFGVAAIVPEGETSARELVQAADQALYKAKNTGRNRIVRMSGRPSLQSIGEETPTPEEPKAQDQDES
ncbi:MAG: diguanylate cyclase [Desulfosarcinaceae bacterium]